MDNDPASPYTRGVGHFSVLLQQCTNHNIKMADQICVKFGGDINIICRIGICLTIQSYLPHSQIALLVSVTQLQGPRFSRPVGLV